MPAPALVPYADLRPMLAVRGDAVPSGEGWTHEVKWDGVRVLVAGGPDGVELRSRAGNVVTGGYPELAPVADRLGDAGTVLDGELVALVDGRPDFGALATRMHVRDARATAAHARRTPVTLLLFDVLRLDGDDLTGLPLAERRAVLEDLDLDWDDPVTGEPAGRVQVPAGYADGAALLAATREEGLEGIVSKRLSSRYEAGARSRAWLKFPHRARVSYVVGGWRVETGSTSRLGALLVGEPTPEGLRYRGRVGSGIAGRAGLLLAEQLAPLTRASSPFADAVPRVDAQGTTWVEPVLVVDVESLGTSTGGRLRQPSYRGLRSDLTPHDLPAQSRPGP